MLTKRQKLNKKRIFIIFCKASVKMKVFLFSLICVGVADRKPLFVFRFIDLMAICYTWYTLLLFCMYYYCKYRYVCQRACIVFLKIIRQNIPSNLTLIKRRCVCCAYTLSTWTLQPVQGNILHSLTHFTCTLNYTNTTIHNKNDLSYTLNYFINQEIRDKTN